MSIAAGTIVHSLRAAAAHVERSLARVVEPFGVTAAQLELLQAIANAEGSGCGCSGLGKQLAAPGPDITRMLDRLDGAGLVARRRDEKDRRVVHAELTESGRQLLEAAGPVVAQAERSLLAGMGEAERDALALLLQGLRRNCPGESAGVQRP